MKKLVKEICTREGKKSQTSIANVRETVSVLMDILAEDNFLDTAEYLSEFNDGLIRKISKIQKKIAKANK
jgi:hypothetical protein